MLLYQAITKFIWAKVIGAMHEIGDELNSSLTLEEEKSQFQRSSSEQLFQ